MKKLLASVGISLLLFSCASNPLTGKKTMAFVSNTSLLALSFQEYSAFLDQSIIISEGPDAEMVQRVGDRIKSAAEKWLASMGESAYLDDYQWEYHLVESDEVNAWCMPGGKIVVYTGILPVTQDEDSLAVVLGHEVSHALLNHGQQSQSAGLIQQIGAVGVDLATSGMGEGTQETAKGIYGTGTTVGGTLPFSRANENEADHYGLILMAIAGYNPDKAVDFWQRMSALSAGSNPEFLSTHPSDENRVKNIQGWMQEAKQKASELNK
jgi:predicted Zn-dependent protease